MRGGCPSDRSSNLSLAIGKQPIARLAVCNPLLLNRLIRTCNLRQGQSQNERPSRSEANVAGRTRAPPTSTHCRVDLQICDGLNIRYAQPSLRAPRRLTSRGGLKQCPTRRGVSDSAVSVSRMPAHARRLPVRSLIQFVSGDRKAARSAVGRLQSTPSQSP